MHAVEEKLPTSERITHFLFHFVGDVSELYHFFVLRVVNMVFFNVSNMSGSNAWRWGMLCLNPRCHIEVVRNSFLAQDSNTRVLIHSYHTGTNWGLSVLRLADIVGLDDEEKSRCVNLWYYNMSHVTTQTKVRKHITQSAPDIHLGALLVVAVKLGGERWYAVLES